MSELLLRLHEDHANAIKLLRLLERQIAVLDAGHRPDWDLVRGVVDYFLTYPALRHHPLEDAVIRRLHQKSESVGLQCDDLLTEHSNLHLQLRRMAAATQSILQDELLLKSDYIRLCRSFIAAQLEHIRREEREFLPAAKQLLTFEDWKELGAAIQEMADPLLDPTDKHFKHIRWQLMHAAEG